MPEHSPNILESLKGSMLPDNSHVTMTECCRDFLVTFLELINKPECYQRVSEGYKKRYQTENHRGGRLYVDWVPVFLSSLFPNLALLQTQAPACYPRTHTHTYKPDALRMLKAKDLVTHN